MSSVDKNWLPRECVLVRFHDDPDLLHWRGILACRQGNLCTVVTPDRDVEETELVVGAVYSEVRATDERRLPRGIKEDETYLPRHAEKGEFSRDEWKKLILVHERKLDSQGNRRRIVGRTDEQDQLPPAPRPPAKGRLQHELGDDDDALKQGVWLLVYRSGSGDLGVEVDPPGDSRDIIVNDKTFRLFSQGGEEFLVRRVSLSSLPEVKKLFQDTRKPVEDGEKDVRILPVIFDAAEERYRTIQEAIPEYDEVDFDDYPLQGPRTMYRDLKQLRRSCQDFMLHHEAWVRKSGVRTSDRSVYEHHSLCRALHLMMAYDQLNMPNLASAESLNRRRALIEYAHAGRPDTPSYEGAEEFMGMKDMADGSMVDPALLQHTAKRQAAKAEIMKQSRLAAEEKKAAKKGEGKGGDKGAKPAPSNP